MLLEPQSQIASTIKTEEKISTAVAQIFQNNMVISLTKKVGNYENILI